MKFDVITIFPRMVQAGLAEGVVSRGIEQQRLDVAVHDLREFTTDRPDKRLQIAVVRIADGATSAIVRLTATVRAGKISRWQVTGA